MKKLLLVSFLLFVTYGMVYSTALLELVSPNGGEGWHIGSEKKSAGMPMTVSQIT
jgi:hypothetical protein